ncbi:MAG: hypothetical protein RLZZ398_617 [Verrucomicrobiota bacterium]|jgi:hypothetical protein
MFPNLATMFKTSSRILIAIAALGLASCSTSVEMPKGTSKGYTSVRLIQRDPAGPAVTNATEKQVHGMIQNSISKQFTSKGMAYGRGSTDLVVAYMVIYQEPGMTSSYETYFGYGRDAGQISDLAHTRGALENQRPDYFRQAGVVIDVIDSRTNKLVYRNFAKGDVIKGASSGTRTARIDAAVAQALGPFFGGN